jgi:hypothetical protein
MAKLRRSNISPEVIQHRLEVWQSCGFSANKAARELGIDRRTMDVFLDRHASDIKTQKVQPMVGELSQTDILDHGTPSTTKRYLLTCAQNNTRVHSGFWANLTAFADHIDATIKVSRFTYNKDAFRGARKAGDKLEEFEPVWAPEVRPFVSDVIERLAPGLVWCGNLQILPTATNPMSGFSDYTGADSTVIPHPKVAMMPVATPRSRPVKHLYTTGACTLKSYIQAKAGQKAEFHHSFAALLVEVMPSGIWFARQIVANDHGSFCDFPYKVVRGQVTEDAEVAAVQWGDIHVANIDKRIEALFWGGGGVLDTLRPKKQLLHDLVDGESHNHHTRRDHHHQFMLAKEGKNSIRNEFEQARRFVDEVAYRPWCKSYVVWSNHDEFIRRYLQNTDYRQDHTNATFILGLELVAYQSIEDGKKPSLFAEALNSKTATVLVDDDGGLLVEGIQVDYHGHVGAGGSRGSVQQYARLGLKTMTGHSHAAWWLNGATSAGTCTTLDMGYNKGPSSWSHTFTIVYRGGKRQQITANAEHGLWRAK